MKALVYTRPMNVEMRELDAPQLRDSEVLVRVRACGVCGSDLHGFRGNSSRRVPPLVLGHEFSGDIIENRCSTRELSVSAGQRNVAHRRCFGGTDG
jgi:threonine dehydrogenase-like Zn-dependent dehydrogenase